MLRISKLAVPLLFAAACAQGSSPSTPPPGPDRPASPDDQEAVSLGMSVLARDGAGAPRLLRAVVPRASVAGMAPEDAARDHLAALAPLYVKAARAMPLTTKGVQTLRNGATVVRLAQEVDGAVVRHGELRVLMHRNGALAAISGTLMPSVAKQSFVLSAREAVERALDQFYGKTRPQLALSDGAASGGWQSITVGSHPDLRVTSARARKELADVGGRLAAAWSVEIFGDDKPDPARDPSVSTFGARRFIVGDGDGRVIDEVSLVAHDAYVYRAYADTTGNRRPFDSVQESFAPHPTGVPDGSEQGFVGSNLVTIDSFNGPRDPWLATNATTTAGNNVVAFSDLDGTGTFTPGDIRPSVRGSRVLNHRFDPTQEPFASEDQLHAGTINAFFVTNWMHDWWYDSGFTEATGNAQLDNFGRGGIGGDPLVLRAQNGAATGERNNAFMATPADGVSPHMLMLLWSSGVLTQVAAPIGELSGEGFVNGPQRFELTGELALANDGTAPTADGCQPIGNVAGKIALLRFTVGGCGSRVMVDNAAAAGAIGVLIADPELESPRLFGGSPVAGIPGLAIGKTPGDRLIAALAEGSFEVTITSEVAGPERDGDFDNSIIAHEWGHYLHHRLADCAGSQCGGMSEGWGDFNALLMMLREGDDREGSFALATYAMSDGVTPDAGYFGLRRFPYSIDRSKNALSLRHIDDRSALPTTTPRGPGGGGLPNSQSHATGEIWASMLWENLNILIDAHGLTVARRRMSDYMVAGLLLTPPNATFTEARDAILAGASALDSDDMLLMAAAFAGRGSGTCASVPPHGTAGNLGVVESGTLAARVEVSSVTLAEDVTSCDLDGYLDPGEAGTLRVTLSNSGPVAAEDVAITATASLAGVRVGPPVRLGTLSPFTGVELEFPVTMLATAPRNANLTINLSIAAEGGCVRNGISVAVNQRIGIDEVAASSRIDRVETTVTPWVKAGDAPEALWLRDTSANPFWRGVNAGFPSDTQLVSPAINVSPSEPFVVRLSHAWSFEGSAAQRFDGGMIELSTNGGATWADVSTFGVNPGYTGPLALGGDNPLEGRPAFAGTSPGFPARIPLALNFGTQFAGQTVLLRFRMGADLNTSVFGWAIDDIEVSGTTNTPFPSVQPEPSVCTRRSGARTDSRIAAVNTSPSTSLASFDAQVCIADDAQ